MIPPDAQPSGSARPHPPGTRLGPYEVLSRVGAGGMGEVYRARDTRLGREVAVKVLPAAVSADAARLRRFEQEARTVGQLDHPNLLTVFDVGRAPGEAGSDGIAYIVTELLKGETLRARLASGALPRRQAVALAAQFARGLAAAHERAVVHRDLKPENLFITSDGRAKILDFGIARTAPDAPPDGSATSTPTETALTEPGAILGTAGYMSPEQVRGEPADARSDLFCLGCVVYEMLTGRRAFAGASTVETLNAILTHSPEPSDPPFAGEHDPLWLLVRRCLEKDPSRRFQNAGDLAFALELAPGTATGAVGTTSPAAAGAPRRPLAAWLAATAVVALVMLTWAILGRRTSGEAPSHMAEATLTPVTVDDGHETDPCFAPDGETIAYSSDRSGNFEIYLQQVSGGPAVNLTRDPGDDGQPSFSPDGRQIAFISTRRRGGAFFFPSPVVPLIGGDLWSMPALGGAPRRIADNAFLPSWSPDGRFVYFSRGPWFRSTIQRVPEGGGPAEVIPVRLPNGASAPYLLSPRVSPDGRWLVFWARDLVYVVPVSGGDARRLAYGRYPVFTDGGRAILYCNALPGRNHSLWRLGFDSARGLARGAPEPLVMGTTESAAPAVTADGRRIAFVAVERRLNLEALPFDANGAGVRGAPITVTTGNHRVRFFTIAPDGRAIVYEDERGAENHLWRVSLAGGESVQLSLDPRFSERFPRWSPDGRMIQFSHLLAGQPEEAGEPWLISADGADPRPAGVPQGGRAAWLPGSDGLLVATRNGRYTRLDLATGRAAELDSSLRGMPFFSLSNDGRWLAYQSIDAGTMDIVAAPLDNSSPPRVVVQTPAEDGHPFFSPDGRWLYYQPNHLNLYRVPGPSQDWRSTPPEQVTRYPERGLYLEEPQVSFDGRTLAYVRSLIRGDLWLLRFSERDSAGAAPGR
jgi:Tol biopolymer transport system component